MPFACQCPVSPISEVGCRISSATPAYHRLMPDLKVWKDQKPLSESQLHVKLHLQQMIATALPQSHPMLCQARSTSRWL